VGDPLALAAALRQLADDPARAAALRTAAAERARRRFDWERVADRYADLLAGVARGGIRARAA
jgi:glycosyltransferase involved in cell wall biosynthesis